MSFVRLFSKASPLLPQRHTFSQTWTWIIANSAAANKHRCMPHLQTPQRTHGQRRTTNPTKLGFRKRLTNEDKSNSDNSCAVTLTFHHDSWNFSWWHFPGQPRSCSSLGWEMQHKTAEARTWEQPFGKSSSWRSVHVTTYQSTAGC